MLDLGNQPCFVTVLSDTAFCEYGFLDPTITDTSASTERYCLERPFSGSARILLVQYISTAK
jgi:hypothetical protein